LKKLYFDYQYPLRPIK